MTTQQRREEESDHERKQEQRRANYHQQSRRKPTAAGLAPVKPGQGIGSKMLLTSFLDGGAIRRTSPMGR
jgi:hypothetical protein